MAYPPSISKFTAGLALSAVLLALSLITSPAGAQDDRVFDLVLAGGRVIDPESGTDGIRDLGVIGGKIAAISTSALKGKQLIDVSGLVVAPGFIDLHAHGQNVPSQIYQARDGVTTALELEAGTYPLDALSRRQGKAVINYGYSAGHFDVRAALRDGDYQRASVEQISDDELASMIRDLGQAMESEGAIGIGIGLDYVSRGVDDRELEALFRLGAKHGMPLFIHIRMPETMDDLSGLQELLDMTGKTGASLHMVHIVSTGLKRVPVFLKMVEEARARGLDVTTEAYPYTAGSTSIAADIFNYDWDTKFGMTYGDIEWPPTGERFTGEEMWQEYREKYPEAPIIVHIMREEWVETALAHPLVMVASDGMPIESLDQRAHPRGMGTFARILGHYVRERGILSLGDAIRKMTLMPARRLEAFVPAMKRKGRLGVGADADITVFDADQVIDRATFAEPNQFSKGIIHVLLGGQFVVRDSELVPDTYLGQPITSGR